MSHVADYELLAYLDGELPDERRAAVSEHVRACEACSVELDSLRAHAERLSFALRAIDRPAPEVDANMILRRHESPFGRRVRRGERRLSRMALAKAAVLLLTVAGASAAAIPGSPVRAWLGKSLASVREFVAGSPEEQGMEPEATVSEAASVAVSPLAGQVRISINRPAADARVRVQLVDTNEAVVSAAGARFRTGAGWIEILDAGPGELRIQLPRSLASARIEVDGQLVVVKEDASLRLLTEPDSAGSEIVFRVGG